MITALFADSRAIHGLNCFCVAEQVITTRPES